ncbi:MAG: nucleotidyltransferase domain-containing protein [Deltaproteobacteria bacterium]|nr:nucleotidyltransferase domain-containing protein [Deltaproteobacteria bacterium]
MKKKLSELCKKYKIIAFFLFGSVATSRANKLSDIDIAFLPKRTLTHRQEDALFLEISGKFHRDDMDLVNLAEAPLSLQYSVINGGKIITCFDKKLLYNFIVKTRSLYLDTMAIREIFAHYLKKRIRTGLFGRG